MFPDSTHTDMDRMNQLSTQDATPAQPAGSGPAGLNLIDFLIVFAEGRRLLIGVPLVVSVLAAGLSLLIPNKYTATTKLLPPQQAQSGAAALLSQLGGGAAGGLVGVKNPNDTYIGMLRSRTLGDALVQRFDLKKVYDEELNSGTRGALERNTVITSGKDNLIVIEVDDRDPKRAAGLANAYVEELLKLTKVLAVTEAAQRRLFFERQLELSKNNLAQAEYTLKSTLGTRGVVSVDAESRTIVETVAGLRAQIAAKQIEINAMSAFVTDNNQQYKRAAQELSSMRAELSKLENGRPELGGTTKTDGQAGLENIKLLRELKYHQMLYELLARQYEAARLDEARDASVIQVLDPAVAPEKKSKPARLLLVIAAGTLALLAVMAWLVLAEARDRLLRDAGNAARAARLRVALHKKKTV